MIRAIKNADINGLNKLPPLDWKFNYEAFLRDFLNDNDFHAFVMISEDEIIGTGNVLHNGKVGWLGNIIVSEENRGKGLGGRMTRFLVDFLVSKSCETQLLLATALGEPVYQKLGFEKITEYHCFDSEVEVEIDIVSSIRALTAENLEDIYIMDYAATGEDRSHLIKKFGESGVGYFDENNEMLGVYLPDFGRGLVLAYEDIVGIELLKLKHSKAGLRTMLPLENSITIDFLGQSELKKGSHCSRMILGKEIAWNPEYIFSYGSGYCG